MIRSRKLAMVLAAPIALAIAAVSQLAGAADDKDEGWVVLVGEEKGLDAWQKPTGAWKVVGDAKLSTADPKHLEGVPGEGVILNDPPGRTSNLESKESFGDVEAHIEFMVPKGSNSGVKFEGLYEIQIFDSYGKEKVDATDCGGIYPHAELLPRYHHTDEGYPPRENASKAPGEWQTLDITFHAPKFDADGKKTANARMVKVVLNGKTLHEDVELDSPTGHFYSRPEHPKAPLLLQADHGPVAFRNVRVKPLD